MIEGFAQFIGILVSVAFIGATFLLVVFWFVNRYNEAELADAPCIMPKDPWPKLNEPIYIVGCKECGALGKVEDVRPVCKNCDSADVDIRRFRKAFTWCPVMERWEICE